MISGEFREADIAFRTSHGRIALRKLSRYRAISLDKQFAAIPPIE
jgi:hypothetical protein